MKKLLSLVLALLLCCALSLSAFADVWIPPIEDGGYCEALAHLPGSSGAEVLNRLASEFLHEKTDEQDVFACARWCEYLGNRGYMLWFEVFSTTDAPETCYALTDPETAENANKVYDCQVQLTYLGDTEATQFEASDFTLTSFRSIDESLVSTELLSRQETPEATVTELDLDNVDSIPVTDAVTDTEAETNAAPETAENTEPDAEKSNDTGFWTTDKIIITAAVAIGVLGAAVAILLIWKKKK